jgi:hypothetical protein
LSRTNSAWGESGEGEKADGEAEAEELKESEKA